ncbi:MAG: YkgJ family cysteine cluster protein [Sedimentisphaerales bacterium]|nr:YkgJ family cysteine cluster protein [Sedimentisphaerales bacterium]
MIGESGIYNSGKKIIGLELDILGESLNFCISVGKGRAKLADIVPLARTVCDKITEITIRRIRSNQGRIPCGKGCSACCRHLVPLSVPEALRLKEEIDAAPVYRRELMLRACLRESRLILNHKLPKTLISQTTESSPVETVDLNLLSSWYRSFESTCPFLNNNVCSIYKQRPLACREHFITGSARACRGMRGDAEVLDIPVRLPNVLGQLASELEGTDIEAVILPLAPVWYEENAERAKRSWPAEMIVRRFIEIVEATAWRNMPAVACQGEAFVNFSETHRVTNQLCRSSSG